MTVPDAGAGAAAGLGASESESAAAALEHLTAVLVGARPTVLVVGDVMLDEYVEGTSDRISPEAPVPIINVAEVRDHLGGAANVARQVAALGGSPVLVGVIGEDAAGERVRDHCARHGIDASGLVVAADRVTTTKQRITVGRQQVARLDREVTDAVRGSIEEQLVEQIASAARPDAIVVSDYAKGAVTPRVLDAVMSAAAQWNVPVLVVPKHRDFGRYRSATVIKVNHVEFESAVGHRLAVDEVADAMATTGRELIASAGVGQLIVTLGAGGLMVLPGVGEPVHVQASARDVYDVSGAGDTVIATLAMMMSAGAPIAEACVVANAAGGLAVQRPGVSVVTAEELAAEFARDSISRRAVMDAAELVERVAEWRDGAKRIVFTNGCFDLFHAGHVHLLTEAARLGDVLVVAVDSDESVRRLKGPSRPIISGSERMAVIAALTAVDAVVPFESSGLEELIRVVSPDVLVKGSDYQDAEVVGAAWVEAQGGSVELVTVLPEWSTTALVDKIRDGG